MVKAIRKSLSLLLLIVVLAGCNSESGSGERDLYQISGEVDSDPSPNGSTVALIGDALYYVSSDIKFETVGKREKKEYSSQPLEVIISVQARLISRDASEGRWEEVADSLKTKKISIFLAPEKNGISAAVIPVTSFLVDPALPGYRKPICIDLGNIVWEDKPKDGWLYGTMMIYFNYGPDVIYAKGVAVQTAYAVPKHEYQVKIRKRVDE